MTIKEVSAVESIDSTIKNMSILRKGGIEVKHTIHSAILKGGYAVRSIADLLHGKWLGHPLHPVLTDVTIGAWIFGTVFDLMWKMTRRRNAREAADTLISIGTASAVPTALTGITDFSAIKQDAVEYGALHGLLNTTMLGLYVLSIQSRKNGDRDRGVLLSTAALSIGLMSAWLGGEMVYRFRVGVNHAKGSSEPEDWHPVMMEINLMENEPQRIDVDDTPVLIYRHEGKVYAISAVCAHAGGPLDEGLFYDTCVQCPWHDSVYDLRDGHVVHGPSTYNQPSYETRIRNGHIELRVTPQP